MPLLWGVGKLLSAAGFYAMPSIKTSNKCAAVYSGACAYRASRFLNGSCFWGCIIGGEARGLAHSSHTGNMQQHWELNTVWLARCVRIPIVQSIKTVTSYLSSFPAWETGSRFWDEMISRSVFHPADAALHLWLFYLCLPPTGEL